jgi:hypothetical protein
MVKLQVVVQNIQLPDRGIQSSQQLIQHYVHVSQSSQVSSSGNMEFLTSCLSIKSQRYVEVGLPLRPDLPGYHMRGILSTSSFSLSNRIVRVKHFHVAVVVTILYAN